VHAYTDRFSALSATTPFPRLKPRLRLAAVLAPACLLSLLTTSYALMKICTLCAGFAFFGDPVIRRGIKYLNRRFPKWQKIIELQKYSHRATKAFSDTDSSKLVPYLKAFQQTPRWPLHCSASEKPMHRHYHLPQLPKKKHPRVQPHYTTRN
jgi:hypothetical protein